MKFRLFAGLFLILSLAAILLVGCHGDVTSGSHGDVTSGDCNTHNLEYRAAVEATCTDAGNSAYWHCSDCDKYFSDAEGNTEIAEDSWVIPAVHDLLRHEAVPHTCEDDGNFEYYECTKCGSLFSDSEATISVTAEGVVDHSAHALEHVERVAPTCTEVGSEEYWKCTACGNLFADSEATMQPGDLTIAATGHTLDKYGECAGCDYGVLTFTSFTYYGEKICEVVSCDKSYEGEIEVPATYDGLPVRMIRDAAFSLCDRITGIVIPDSVTAIGQAAFEGCTSLESLTLPFVGQNPEHTQFSSGAHFGNLFDRVPTEGTTATVIEHYSNTYTYYIPDSLKNVTVTGGNLTAYAFKNCKTIENVILKEGVNILGNEVFRECASLKSVVLPEGLTRVNYNTFYLCPVLETVIIPEGVTTIDRNAFRECVSLKNLDLPDSLTYVEDSAFINCGAMQYEDGIGYVDNWAVECDPEAAQLTIREGTVGVGAAAFYESSALLELIVPDSVTYMCTHALIRCPQLVTYIEHSQLPDTWDEEWSLDSGPVYWNYSGAQVTYSFVTNAEEEGVVQEEIVSDRRIDLPVPVREGYFFNGWRKSPDLSGERQANYFYSGEDITLYAGWIAYSEIITITNDEVYPFIQDGLSFTSDNKHKNSSSATLRVTADRAMELSFEYYTSCEYGDNFIVVAYDSSGVELFRDTVSTIMNTRKSATVTLEAGAYIECTYSKDNSNWLGEDCGYFNILEIVRK